MPILCYRQSDRIKLLIHDIEFILKPLSYSERMEASSFVSQTSGTQMQNMLSMAKSLIKNSLIEAKGIFYPDGTEFKITIDQATKKMSDDSIDELRNTSIRQDLTTALSKIMNGVPDEFLDFETGKPHEYIKIIHPETALQLKKK